MTRDFLSGTHCVPIKQLNQKTALLQLLAGSVINIVFWPEYIHITYVTDRQTDRQTCCHGEHIHITHATCSAGLTTVQVVDLNWGLWTWGPDNFTEIIFIHTKYIKKTPDILSGVFFSSSKYSKTCFRPGLCPAPHCGSLRRSPRPRSRFLFPLDATPRWHLRLLGISKFRHGGLIFLSAPGPQKS